MSVVVSTHMAEAVPAIKPLKAGSLPNRRRVLV